MGKTITCSLGEWYYLTLLVQGRRNELISKQYKWDKEFNIAEEVKLDYRDEDELKKCCNLYNLLNEQVGLTGNLPKLVKNGDLYQLEYVPFKKKVDIDASDKSA